MGYNFETIHLMLTLPVEIRGVVKDCRKLRDLLDQLNLYYDSDNQASRTEVIW